MHVIHMEETYIRTYLYSSLCTDRVLMTTLSLYVEDKSLPLPTLEEILICNPSTTSEEVRLINEQTYAHTYMCTCMYAEF